jgi:hypothetical protein
MRGLMLIQWRSPQALEHLGRRSIDRSSDAKRSGISMSYVRFAVMIMVATVIMFVLMYLNTYASEHVFWSETRLDGRGHGSGDGRHHAGLHAADVSAWKAQPRHLPGLETHCS